MEKEFVPYEISLALKELGFDEPCWCYFINDVFNDSMFPKTYEYFEHMSKNMEYTLAPLLSQVFRWFREKYGYFTSPTESDDDTTKKYDWLITKNLGKGKIFIKFIGYKDSYEEAELECIIKLIEIIKN
jgi:uncharacterized protein YozE (UPF0346 family)